MMWGGGNLKFEIEREVFSSLFICTKTKILQEYKTLNFLLRSPHGNRQKSPWKKISGKSPKISH